MLHTDTNSKILIVVVVVIIIDTTLIILMTACQWIDCFMCHITLICHFTIYYTVCFISYILFTSICK